jgi:hypothetical protein
MIDDQASRLKAVSQEDEPFFLVRVIGIIDQAGVLVEENTPCFLEGDAMLNEV